jgi:hypothetical protein
LIPSGLLLIGAVFLKESPRWLFSRGRREDAIKNLCWIRQLPADHIYMIEEIGAVDQALEEQRTTIGLGFWKPFKAAGTNKKVMYRLFLGSMLFFWQNGSGINAINYYSPTVFKSIGLQGANTSMFSTGIFGVVKTVVTFVWLLYLIDRVGRRLLLLIGAAGASVCLFIVGAYIKIADPASNPTQEMTGGGIAAMFFFYLYTVFYTPSWNGTPWVMNSVCPLFTCVKCFTDYGRKCSSPTCAPWHRPARPRPTGSGIFWSRASRRRCLPRWSTVCGSSLPR